MLPRVSYVVWILRRVYRVRLLSAGDIAHDRHSVHGCRGEDTWSSGVIRGASRVSSKGVDITMDMCRIRLLAAADIAHNRHSVTRTISSSLPTIQPDLLQ